MVKIMKLNKELFNLPKSLDNVVLKGLNDTAFCHLVNEVFDSNNQNIIIITPTLFEANKLINILNSYT